MSRSGASRSVRSRCPTREREAEQLLAGARVEEQATLEGARLRAESRLREAEQIHADAVAERDRLLGEATLQAAASEIVMAASDRARGLEAEAGRLLDRRAGGGRADRGRCDELNASSSSRRHVSPPSS